MPSPCSSDPILLFLLFWIDRVDALHSAAHRWASLEHIWFRSRVCAFMLLLLLLPLLSGLGKDDIRPHAASMRPASYLTHVTARQLSKRLTRAACVQSIKLTCTLSAGLHGQGAGAGGEGGGEGRFSGSFSISAQAASTLYACPCLAGQLERITHHLITQPLGHDRTADQIRGEGRGFKIAGNARVSYATLLHAKHDTSATDACSTCYDSCDGPSADAPCSAIQIFKHTSCHDKGTLSTTMCSVLNNISESPLRSCSTVVHYITWSQLY